MYSVRRTLAQSRGKSKTRKGIGPMLGRGHATTYQPLNMCYEAAMSKIMQTSEMGVPQMTLESRQNRDSLVNLALDRDYTKTINDLVRRQNMTSRTQDQVVCKQTFTIPAHTTPSATSPYLVFGESQSQMPQPTQTQMRTTQHSQPQMRIPIARKIILQSSSTHRLITVGPTRDLMNA